MLFFFFCANAIHKHTLLMKALDSASRRFLSIVCTHTIYTSTCLYMHTRSQLNQSETDGRGIFSNPHSFCHIWTSNWSHLDISVFLCAEEKKKKMGVKKKKKGHAGVPYLCTLCRRQGLKCLCFFFFFFFLIHVCISYHIMYLLLFISSGCFFLSYPEVGLPYEIHYPEHPKLPKVTWGSEK